MDVTCFSEDGGCCVVPVEPEDTVFTLRGKAVRLIGGGMNVRSTDLRFGGAPLGDDEELLSETSLTAGDTVEVVHSNVRIKTPSTYATYGHTSTRAVLSPCNKHLYILGVDSTMRQYDTQSGEKITSFDIYSNTIPSFSPCGNWLACGCGAAVLIYNTQSGAKRFALSARLRSVTGWSLCGRWVVAASLNGEVRVWDIEADQQPCRVTDSATDGIAVVVSELKAYATRGSDIVAISLKDLSSQRSLHGHEKKVHDLRLSEDSVHLVSASSDRSVRVWSLEEERCLRVFTFDGICARIAAATNVVIVQSDKGVFLCNIDTEQTRKLADLPGHTFISMGVEVSACGRVVFLPKVDVVEAEMLESGVEGE